MNASPEAESVPFTGSPSSQVAEDGVPVNLKAGAVVCVAYLLIEALQEGVY